MKQFNYFSTINIIYADNLNATLMGFMTVDASEVGRVMASELAFRSKFN